MSLTETMHPPLLRIQTTCSAPFSLFGGRCCPPPPPPPLKLDPAQIYNKDVLSSSSHSCLCLFVYLYLVFICFHVLASSSVFLLIFKTSILFCRVEKETLTRIRIWQSKFCDCVGWAGLSVVAPLLLIPPPSFVDGQYL